MFGDGRDLVAWNDTRFGDPGNGSAWAARVEQDGTVVDRVRLGYARGEASVMTAFDGNDYLAVCHTDLAGFNFRNKDVLGRAIPPSGAIGNRPVSVAASYGHQFGPVVGFGGDRFLAVDESSQANKPRVGRDDHDRAVARALTRPAARWRRGPGRSSP